LVVAAVLGNVVQHAPVFSAERMKPKFSKISPLKGFKRIFGTMAFVNFGKGLAKLSVVGLVTFFIIWPQRDLLLGVMAQDISGFFPFVLQFCIEMMGAIVAVLAFIAVLDFIYQRYDYTKRQRMTKQEVKDEHKQTEGDPAIRAKLRQIRMERGRQRMMAQVPNASVVITNPTHFAVALSYESDAMSAPICVAKGADVIAHRIREVAKENDVPIVENPPLARALYQSVDIDDEVPAIHYKAVAQVIGYVMRLKGKSAQKQAT
jgi:flagellar biosynthetic protein FlhB